jgi:SAM-dependent methyltransferase
LIVELGSASGNASILFALLGARVVGLDFDPVMVSAARRRQAIYEQHFGPLALEFRVADAREFDCRALGRIDGVYSLFALNLMQPAARVLSRVLPALGPDARVVISDGNRRNLYNRLFRPRPALSPQELQSFLNRTGLATTCEFHCAVPPLLARSGPLFALAVGLEAAARRSRLLPRLGVSYTLFAQGAA